MEKAGFGARLIAYILDGFIIGLVLVAVFMCSFTVIMLTSDTGSDFLGIIAGGTAILLFFVMLLAQFIYFGYFWSKNGQTLGMKLLGIKVIRRTEGEGLSFFRAALRGTLGYWISSLVFSLGFLWALFDENKETWHDKIFDTWVVVA